MKARIFGSKYENIECTSGLLTTVYYMVGGKKYQNTIKKIILDDSDIPDIVSPDIKNHLEIMKNILFKSYTLINDAKASSLETHGEPPEEYALMSRMGYVFFAMSIIDLSKLFISSTSHHFNFYSYIKKLELLKKNNSKIKNIEHFSSEDYMCKLNKLEKNGIIENLSGLRDKIFAHTDKGVIDKSINYTISISGMEQLLSVGLEIISDISIKLFETQIEEFIPSNAVESVLKILNKELGI